MATKTIGEKPSDVLANIRAKIKEEGREARVYPENLDIGKGKLPQTFVLLPEDPSVEEIPISNESAERSIKGVDGYRKTKDGLVWDVLSYKCKQDGTEMTLNVDTDNEMLNEQLVSALDAGEGSPVKVTIEMRPSKKHKGQSYKNVRVLGTVDED